MEWDSLRTPTPAASTSASSSNPSLDSSPVTPKATGGNDGVSCSKHDRRYADASSPASLPSSSMPPEDPLKAPSSSHNSKSRSITGRQQLPAGSGFPLTASQSESTRPSLSRLTSAARLASGLGFGLANASTDSISTQDDVGNGSRRSLDELRKLSIKGKSRAVDQNGDQLHDELGLLGENGLQETGREALLHMVSKGDSLIGIALLYGCTAQAIRTANKLWLNDPIQLRKSLYIPLDACTQPPSKEYEFIQKSGENVLHLYHRQAAALSTASPGRLHERAVSRSRMRSSSLLQAALSIDRPLTPYHDEIDSPSEQSSARSSISLTRSASAMPPYLAETNSDYGDGPDELFPSSSSRLSDFGSRAGSPPPGSAGLPMASSPVGKSSLVEKGTMQIVRMPVNAGAAKGKGKGKVSSGLSSSEKLVDAPLPLTNGKRRNSKDTIQGLAVSSSSLLTPSSSSDRLSSLMVPGLSASGGSSANLRMRPRSPFEGASVDPSTPITSVNFPGTPSGPSRGSSAAFPPRTRTRKMSKDIVPRSVSSTHQQKGTGASKAFSYLGQLLNGTGTVSGSSLAQQGKSWLGVGDFEDEIELARAYQDNRLRKVSSAGRGER